VSDYEVSAAAARQRFTTLLAAAERDGRHVTVTRHGVPAAVIVPPAWYRQALAGDLLLTRENPIQPLGGEAPFTGEVRFRASTELLMRLLEEAYRRAGGGDRREALNAILVEAASDWLDQAEAAVDQPSATEAEGSDI
jgi:prevent-host-death family protein